MMHRKKVKPINHDYDIYRQSAQAYFEKAEECMNVGEEASGGHDDISTQFKAKKQEESILLYASAIEKLLRIPQESRKSKDNTNLDDYFKKHVEAYKSLGYDKLGHLLESQRQTFVEQISESSAEELKEEQRVVKRKAHSMFAPVTKKTRLGDDDTTSKAGKSPQNPKPPGS